MLAIVENKQKRQNKCDEYDKMKKVGRGYNC